jgi:hypothetical protein
MQCNECSKILLTAILKTLLVLLALFIVQDRLHVVNKELSIFPAVFCATDAIKN